MHAKDITKYQGKDLIPLIGLGIYLERIREFRFSLQYAIDKRLDTPIIEEGDIISTEEQAESALRELNQFDRDVNALIRIQQRADRRMLGLEVLNAVYLGIGMAAYSGIRYYGPQILSTIENLVK